jgi:acyl-CoA thioester hydrolase
LSGSRWQRLGASSIAYRLGLFVNDARPAAVEGEYIHVVIDRATRKATPILDFARAADFGALRGDPHARI